MIDDHKLTIKKLLQKYNIKSISKKLYASVNDSFIYDDDQRGNNIAFPKKDYTLLQLTFEAIIDPVNVMSLLCAAFLVIVYEFNEEETRHLLVFLATLLIMIIKAVFEVYEQARINSVYKKRIDFYNCRIIKDDRVICIDKELIKIGDVLDLRKGDIVGADAILIGSNNLLIERSIESYNHQTYKKTHSKHSDEFEESENVVLCYDKVINGRGRALVVRIGTDTKISKVYKSIFYLKKYESDLYSEMTIFFFVSIVFGLFLSLIFILIGLSTGISFFNSVDLTISVIIALIPEGIPSTVKLLLFSTGTRLGNKNIYIRDINCIEKLGLVTRILAEKDALVPKDNVVCSYVFDGNDLYDIELAFIDNNQEALSFIQKIGYITKLICSSKNVDKNKGHYIPLDSLGDICIRYFVDYTRIPISTKEIKLRNLNGIVIDYGDYKTICVIGRVEAILGACSQFVDKSKLKKSKKLKILNLYHKMVIEGYDGIGMAFRSFGKYEEHYKLKGLMFSCLYFFQEIPESDIPLVSNVLKSADIKFSIITEIQSENKLNSSRNILELNEKFVKDDKFLNIVEPATDQILRADEYKEIEEEAKNRFISQNKFIIYRSDSISKYEVVNDLKKNGEIVCYIGSETNDSMALNRSDIGVCFQDSSRICKEASSIVFNKNEFENIIYSLEEGRLFLVNLQKSIRYILMHITPQILPFLIYVALGTPMPLSPMLLIFLNYLVEVIPAIFFSYEEPEVNLLVEPPKQRKFNIELSEYFEDSTITELSYKFKYYVYKTLNIVNNGVIYNSTVLSWSIVEAGLISFIGCELAFYSVLYINKIPFSKMFFTANEYFQYKSPDLILSDGTVIDFEKQLDIVFEGQSTYFVGLIICQFANMLVCRRFKEYFFTKFFNNFKIVVFTLVGMIISIVIVSVGVFDTFMLIRGPDAFSLIYPVGAAVILLIVDTIRKYKMKRMAE